MGIQGLTKLLADAAPEVLQEKDIKNFFGRTVAIDASMCLYQFEIAIRPDAVGAFTLTNDQGESTSHLNGIFYRTIRMMSNGIRPIYVFDGKPPELKAAELAKRKKKKEESKAELEKAEEDGDKELQKQLNKRTIRVTPEMNEEAKKLLKLMGCPVVQAPCEAEAQCAVLCRSGAVWATGTEDMDALTCGSSILLRHMTFSEARKMPIIEIHIDKVLKGLDLNMDEFIDLCILLGCDYTPKIKGIGPKRALELIQKHRNIETILKHLNKEKYIVPDPFPYQEIRSYFKNPDSAPASDFDLTFTQPDEEGLLKFMVEEKGFSEERIKGGIEKIKKSRSTSVQSRLENFFKVAPAAPSDNTPKKGKVGAKKELKNATGQKRPGTPQKGSPLKKAKK